MGRTGNPKVRTEIRHEDRGGHSRRVGCVSTNEGPSEGAFWSSEKASSVGGLCGAHVGALECAALAMSDMGLLP